MPESSVTIFDRCSLIKWSCFTTSWITNRWVRILFLLLAESMRYCTACGWLLLGYAIWRGGTIAACQQLTRVGHSLLWLQFINCLLGQLLNLVRLVRRAIHCILVVIGPGCCVGSGGQRGDCHQFVSARLIEWLDIIISELRLQLWHSCCFLAFSIIKQ